MSESTHTRWTVEVDGHPLAAQAPAIANESMALHLATAASVNSPAASVTVTGWIDGPDGWARGDRLAEFRDGERLAREEMS